MGSDTPSSAAHSASVARLHSSSTNLVHVSTPSLLSASSEFVRRVNVLPQRRHSCLCVDSTTLPPLHLLSRPDLTNRPHSQCGHSPGSASGPAAALTTIACKASTTSRSSSAVIPSNSLSIASASMSAPFSLVVSAAILGEGRYRNSCAI